MVENVHCMRCDYDGRHSLDRAGGLDAGHRMICNYEYDGHCAGQVVRCGGAKGSNEGSNWREGRGYQGELQFSMLRL